MAAPQISDAVRYKIDLFRIKELKEVLGQLGLSKTGKKQVLLERLLAVLGEDCMHHWPNNGVAHGDGSLGKHSIPPDRALAAIDDVFRRMQSGSPDASAAGSVKSILARIQKDRESNGAGGQSAAQRARGSAPAATVRCPCGSTQAQGQMLQCEEASCRVLQHAKCVGVGDDKKAEQPHLCEVCRISKADPFTVTLAHPMPSTKLKAPLGKTDSMMQQVERAMSLNRAQMEQLAQPGCELQAWCVLLQDPVPLRMHWPAYADLRINGMPVRVSTRMGQQKLGQNGRDEGPLVSGLAREGLNRYSFSCYDERSFVVGVRLVQRRTLEEVLAALPSVATGEPFAEALARVKRSQGAGKDAGGPMEDGSCSESEEELVTLHSAFSLRCPMSGSRIKVPGRFRGCTHMGCFDLHTLVELNQRARKWQCPICMRNSSADCLYIDPYFHRVLSILRKEWEEEVVEVEIAPDGAWKAFLTGEVKKRAGGVQPRWHRPEETLETWRPQSPPKPVQAPPTLPAPAPHANGLPKSSTPLKVKTEGGERVPGSLRLKIRLKRDRPSDEGTAGGGWQDGGGRAAGVGPNKVQKLEVAALPAEAPPPPAGAVHGVPVAKKKAVLIELSDSEEEGAAPLLTVQAPKRPAQQLANGRSAGGGGSSVPSMSGSSSGSLTGGREVPQGQFGGRAVVVPRSAGGLPVSSSGWGGYHEGHHATQRAAGVPLGRYGSDPPLRGESQAGPSHSALGGVPMQAGESGYQRQGPVGGTHEGRLGSLYDTGGSPRLGLAVGSWGAHGPRGGGRHPGPSGGLAEQHSSGYSCNPYATEVAAEVRRPRGREVPLVQGGYAVNGYGGGGVGGHEGGAEESYRAPGWTDFFSREQAQTTPPLSGQQPSPGGWAPPRGGEEGAGSVDAWFGECFGGVTQGASPPPAPPPEATQPGYGRSYAPPHNDPAGLLLSLQQGGGWGEQEGRSYRGASSGPGPSRRRNVVYESDED